MNTKTEAWLCGMLGVAIFSASLPATRIAVTGFSPLFLTSARAVIAAILAAILLRAMGEKRPSLRDLGALAVVALGVVLGFPLLTALALQHITSAHSIVFIGLLPLATAFFGLIRGGERPRAAFWVFAILGSLTVAGFALGGDYSASWQGDLLMIGAVALCGLGYAEGARLSRRLGGWQVISWSLVLAAPVMAATTWLTWPSTFAFVPAPAWLGLAYVSVFSMLVGFVFWYRGLALGGTASIGQLQLLQPFLGLLLAGLLLGEPVAWTMVAATLAVIVFVTAARRYA